MGTSWSPPNATIVSVTFDWIHTLDWYAKGYTNILFIVGFYFAKDVWLGPDVYNCYPTNTKDTED